MLRGYGLAEPDLTDAVRLLRSTFHGFVALEASGGFAHERSPQQSWVCSPPTPNASNASWRTSRRWWRSCPTPPHTARSSHAYGRRSTRRGSCRRWPCSPQVSRRTAPPPPGRRP
ncbi:TetR-like C-terminal domain-containing protein [Streptomyces virginiae]|uniref:TetR-like C-terminal domain-containing protein n=1 Tax=Streptomyces virginiae TaxID=1961 RepID=UPI003825F496